MIYRALSLHQPHATLIAHGIKTIETRTRRTHIRGDVLICSARNYERKVREECSKYYLEKISPVHPMYNTFGRALALVELYDCVPLKEGMRKDAALLDEHDIEGRWAYMLRNIRPVQGVFHVTGRQGFFNVDSEKTWAGRNQISLKKAFTERDFQRIEREHKGYYRK